MASRRVYIRSRRGQVAGRGVEALFGDPEQIEDNEVQTAVILSAEATAEEELEQLLAYEALSAATGVDPRLTKESDGDDVGVMADADEPYAVIDVALVEQEDFEPGSDGNQVALFDDDLEIPEWILAADSNDAPEDVLFQDESVEELTQSSDRPRVTIDDTVPEMGNINVELEAESVEPDSPFIRPAPSLETPKSPRRTAEEKQRIVEELEEARIAALHTRIDKLYGLVPERISNRPDVSEQVLSLLRESRSILIEKPHDFVIAEYKVQKAYSLFNRVETSEREGDKYGWLVFWYEVVTFIILLTSFLLLLAVGDYIAQYVAGLFGDANPDKGILSAVGFWSTFVWGGIGGAVGAMYILWTHVSQRQDFERQHVMWYIGQPFMGLVLGGVVYLIINAGLLSLQGGEAASDALRNQVQFFPALIAFIAGFRPQFVFGMLVKIIDVLNPSEATA